MKKVTRLTESNIRQMVRQAIKEALQNSDGMIRAIMDACNVGAKEAQEYLDGAADEIHTWMSQGVDPLKPTGYGGNYFQEQMRDLGLDDDYLMNFAQYCYATYDDSKYVKDDEFLSEEDFFGELENEWAEKFLPLKLYTDMYNSVALYHYDNIGEANQAMKQDVVNAYNRMKKELSECLPVKIGKPKIEKYPNGTEDFIVPIEYDEEQAKEMNQQQ